MLVVTPPPKRNFFKQAGVYLLILGAIAASIFFLVYRFSDPIEVKAEKLFIKRQLDDLHKFTKNKLEGGASSPVLFSYYVVAEFSLNKEANLNSLLSNLEAIAARPVFRRETLLRLLQIPSNNDRHGAILSAMLHIDKDTSMQQHTKLLFEGNSSLESDSKNFELLEKLFAPNLRTVKARNLQFRDAPSTDSSVLRRLTTGEKLLIRKSGEKTTVSGKSGKWVFVLDTNMHSGWVFDAYLSQP